LVGETFFCTPGVLELALFAAELNILNKTVLKTQRHREEGKQGGMGDGALMLRVYIFMSIRKNEWQLCSRFT
jgi:hypothetical protein